ncbi:hypothetical protein B0O99DRAFT_97655 [Bisporella sp. PMI_857]|nr:hypothetical protein B0O99DRAFT_97655 [Bisporella sp. PMI_857]
MRPAEPSLLLAKHDIAHREHNHNHNHSHQHRKLHKRQAAGTGSVEIVEVVQTVSVIQRIDVDANGNTVATLYTPVPQSEAANPTLTDASPTPSGSDPTVSQAPLPDSTQPTTSGSSPEPTLSPTSGTSLDPALPSALSPTSTFPSLIVSSNSTNPLSSSTSGLPTNLFPTFSNSSISSTGSVKVTLTYLTSSSSPNFRGSGTSTSSALFSDSTSNPSSDSAGGFIAGATGVDTGATSSSTADADGSSKSGNNSATPTPVIIGSVVSSIAGAAVLVLILLFIWRWRKRNRSMIQLGNGDSGPAAIREAPSSPPAGGMMVERRSFANAVPAALASLTGMKRYSHRTERDTISSTAGSERGFYRVSGRKIPSVLHSGGDGYGGDYTDEPMPPIRDERALSNSSWYRDSQGFSGGPGTPAISKLNLGMVSTSRDSGIPYTRPSPARTPVIEHGPFMDIPINPSPPRRPDDLGRSHPSQDGSHASRFTEEV